MNSSRGTGWLISGDDMCVRTERPRGHVRRRDAAAMMRMVGRKGQPMTTPLSTLILVRARRLITDEDN